MRYWKNRVVRKENHAQEEPPQRRSKPHAARLPADAPLRCDDWKTVEAHLVLCLADEEDRVSRAYQTFVEPTYRRTTGYSNHSDCLETLHGRL